MDDAAANDDENKKSSGRAMLSKAHSVPQWLMSKYVLPGNTIVHHTLHKDSTLPLFQGKLQGNELFEGKILA